MAQPQPAKAYPVSAVEDLTGATVGRFLIRERLGAGGMGEVYRADDPTLKRPVALKRLAPHLRTDVHLRRRLLREAERASALNHQHIASIYDVLEQGGELFLVMEYVEGSTWRERLRESMPLAEFLKLAVQCAEALVAAQEQGIVHCDIKPENIMLMSNGQVKILDFGVAKRIPCAGDGGVTETVTLAAGLSGTPAYMAPEVLREQEPDGRADIFSLGVVFYEALAGEHPFRAGNFVETTHRILRETPPLASDRNPDVPVELASIVARMLAKEPAGRYATARELAQSLHAVQRSAPAAGTSTVAVNTSAVTVAGVPTAVPPARRLRRGWLYAAGAVVALAVITLTVPPVQQRLRTGVGLPGVPGEKHIAVLPFTNIGGDAANQAFCDGLAETLTSKLTELEQFQGSLRVVPFSEVRRGGVETAEVARRWFAVNLVLTGSVQRMGDTIRLTANLVDAGTLRQLRSHVFDDRVTNVSLWQDDTVLELARMLEVELQPRSRQVLAAGRTEDADAYHLYVEGRGVLQRYEKLENVERAIGLFEKAIARDARYALAHGALGEAFWRRYDLTKEKDWAEKARESCQRALDLDAGLVPLRVTLAMVLTGTGRAEEAVKHLQRALQLDPVHPAVHRELGRVYESQGKVVEAELTYRKAVELRPSDWSMHNVLGVFYYRRGRYEEAANQFKQVVELVPDNHRGHDNLGGIYHLLGRYDEAVAEYRRSLELRPDATAYSNLGTLYFFRQRYAEAAAMFEKATELVATEFVHWGNLGDAYRWAPGLGDKAPVVYRRAVELCRGQLQVNPRDAHARSSLALYQVKLQESAAALQEIARARRDAPHDVNVMFNAAVVYQLAGQRAQALDALERAVRAGYSADEARNEPELAALRGEPRFQRLFGGGQPR